MSFKWNWAGHCGAPGCGSLHSSHSLLWETDSSLCNLPWVPNSRFKQWLIREGRECRVKEGVAKKPSEARKGTRETHQDQEATWGQIKGGQSCAMLGLPGGSDGRESACNAGDPSLYPWAGSSPGEGNGFTHSSIPPWRIPRTEEPGVLRSLLL